MPAFTVHQSIQRPCGEVFRIFTEFSELPNRVSGITRLEVLGHAPVGEGFRWRETRHMFGREASEEMQITEFVTGRSYTVKAESHGTRYTSTFVFEPDGAATTVRCHFQVKPVSLAAKMLSPLGAMMMGSTRKLVARDIDDLKQFAERH